MHNPLIWTYLAYLTLAIGMTIWVAYTLHRNGAIFLVDAFAGNQALAASVNHLLVVGFYLVNIGFIGLAIRYGDRPIDTASAVEEVAVRVGRALLVLGFMHFANVWVFNRMRVHARLHQAPPPVEPDQRLA